ncbi:MAG: hypothetical protein JSV49_06075 [Thermoplasmata archaeon]|nr:MAG: hypothetical protein JSV49_06075 [Thermoplasmata archaeon]
MTGEKKSTTMTCDDCEHFLRMYKGAGVGTCKKGSKKYRSEDSVCDYTEKEENIELDSILSGFRCHNCGDEIGEHDFRKEHSIGPFDSQGKIIHYFCTDCWTQIDREREEVRKHFDIG